VSEQETKPEIKVEDRRLFDREGNVIASGEKGSDEGKAKQEAPPDLEPSREKLDFVAVLFSYVHTALVHLGDLEDPIKKITSENLEGARQMIEILELIQEKTKGNLDQNEERYLSGSLFNLRIRYMQKVKLIG